MDCGRSRRDNRPCQPSARIRRGGTFPALWGRASNWQCDGVNRLIKKVHAAGAKLILLTPPPFDPQPMRGKGKLKSAGEKEYAYFAVYENYDDVLCRYGAWIMEQKDRVEMVIDVHGPLSGFVEDKRQQNENFVISPDGVHLDATGHRVMGQAILRRWGFKATSEPNKELLQLMTRRGSILHDAWLSKVGHKRPGVKPGLPLDKANEAVTQLEVKISLIPKQSQ